MKNLTAVEYDVNMINNKMRNCYNLGSDWLGDCMPFEIKQIMSKMLFCNEEEYQEYLEEIENMLEFWAAGAAQNEAE